MAPRLHLVALALPLVLASSCFGAADADAWRDQLQPTAPCYQVDLGDGLDESSTAEVDLLFACLDRQGHFEALRPFAETWSQPTRSGRPAGVELASAVNGVADVGVNPFDLVGVTRDLVQSPDAPITDGLDMALELIYGRSAAQVRLTGFSLTDADALASGSLAPLAHDLPAIAAGALDTEGDLAVLLGDLTRGEELRRWLWTLDAVARSSRSDVTGPTRPLLAHAGELIQASRSPWNDTSSLATGDSLRDLGQALAGGSQPVLGELSPQLDRLLGDATVRTELQSTLVDLEASGVLAVVPDQAAWLATVDVQGGSLSQDEASALEAFARLLANTNAPMQCSVSLGWFGSLQINLGNVAVSMADVLADQDPWAVDTGIGLFGAVLNFSLTDWALQAIADSDTCSAFTPQVLSDLQVLDLMREPQTDELLAVVIQVLHVAKHGQTNHIPDVVDSFTVLYDRQAIPAIVGFAADLDGAPVVQDLVALVPVLAAPRAYGLDTPSGRPGNLQDLLLDARWLVQVDGGRTGWQRLQPVAQPLIDGDGLWGALDGASAVLTDPNARLPRALELVPALLDADPELTLLDAAAPVLSSRKVGDGLAALLERPDAAQALLSPTPVGDSPEVPLAFAGRLIAHGALDDLLGLVDRLFTSLEATP